MRVRARDTGFSVFGCNLSSGADDFIYQLIGILDRILVMLTEKAGVEDTSLFSLAQELFSNPLPIDFFKAKRTSISFKE